MQDHEVGWAAAGQVPLLAEISYILSISGTSVYTVFAAIFLALFLS